MVFAAGPLRAADSDATSAGQLTTISQAFFMCLNKLPAHNCKDNSSHKLSCNFEEVFYHEV